ncbi:MAG: hypothetical protein HYX35_06165 [Proteobacteria bacterium]|nr:hypothetical protein [Pseudomonadota bacterium]
MTHGFPPGTHPMEIEYLEKVAGAALEVHPQEDVLDEQAPPTFPPSGHAPVGFFFGMYQCYLGQEASLFPSPDVMRVLVKYGAQLGLGKAICQVLPMAIGGSKTQRNSGIPSEELEARALALTQYPDFVRVMKSIHNSGSFPYLLTLEDILKYPTDEVGKRTRVIGENHFKLFKEMRFEGDVFARTLFSLHEGQLTALVFEENVKTLFANYKMAPSFRAKVLTLLWMCDTRGLSELAGYMVPWLDDLGDGAEGQARYREVLWILMRDILPPSLRFGRLKDEMDLNAMRFNEAVRTIEARRKAAP